MRGDANPARSEVKKALHALQKRISQMEDGGNSGELAGLESLEQLLEG